MNIIAIAWKTDVMPVYAHEYYHADCYVPMQPRLGKVIEEPREINVTDVSVHATCAGCGYKLKDSKDCEESA